MDSIPLPLPRSRQWKPGLYHILHDLHHHLGGGVRAGAEGQAGVENDFEPVGGFLRQPVGQHHNALADLLRRVIVLPAFLPVGFGEGGGGHGQTKLVHRRVQTLPTVIVGVLQIQLDPGKPLKLFLQPLVDVIPVRPVFL